MENTNIMGMDGLKDAYETGRGKIKMRVRAHIESNKNGKSRWSHS